MDAPIVGFTLLIFSAAFAYSTSFILSLISDADDGDRLGQSVGLGTNRIAVGAPHADPSGASSGKV